MLSKIAKLFLVALAVFFAYMATPLRIYNLENRVPHADEGEQTFTTARLIQDSKYAYNPNGPHGPILYYWAKMALPKAKLETFDIPDLRRTLLPIFYATLALLFAAPFCLKEEKCECERECKCEKDKIQNSKNSIANYAFAAACVGFLCISSLSAIYSTYFVQETFFALFGLAFCIAGSKFLKSPKPANAAVLGLCAGGLQITKETSVVAFLAIFLAWLICDFSSKEYRKKFVQGAKTNGVAAFVKIALCAILPAAFVYAIFYSSFGENPQGLVDGIKCYFTHFAEKSASAAHSKDFFYYVELLTSTKSQGAIFGEIAISTFAFLGTIYAFTTKNRLVKYASTFAWLNIFLMSFFSYKTPWLMLMPLTCLCIPAGYAVKMVLFAKIKNRPVFTVVRFALFAAILYLLVATQLKQQRNAARFYACDPRNPMIYVHTLKNEERLVNRIKLCAKVADKNFRVLVLTKNSPWPLPWQLLRLDCADFCADETQVKDFSQYSIVVHDAPFDELFKGKFSEEKYLEEFFGLRENLLLRVHTKRDIFEKSIR